MPGSARPACLDQRGQRAWISATSVPGSARPACLNQRGQRAWISAASVPGSARPACLDPVGRSVVSACASDGERRRACMTHRSGSPNADVHPVHTVSTPMMMNLYHRHYGAESHPNTKRTSTCTEEVFNRNMTAATTSGQCIVDSRGIKLQNLMSICVGGSTYIHFRLDVVERLLLPDCVYIIDLSRLC